jgi:radical SAM superfamily enzyme YgiQ (UPF0313 family)
MKKILLAAVNARYTHSCLALYCLKSYARGLNGDIAVREYSINRDAAGIAADIASARPDAVGLSVYIWNAELIRKILPVLDKSIPGSVLILGGPEVSYNPDSWLKDFPCVDFIITGHGEAAFRYLAEREFQHDEKIISRPNPPFADLPLPYDEGDLDGLAERYVYYESSRGCPFRCAYCLSSREDQKFESKRAETAGEELRFILSHKPKLVKFVDRTFNLNGDRYRAIWKFLLDGYRGGPTSFHFEIHPSYLVDEDFALLSRCPEGLFQFEIGVQSTNSETLAAVHRAGDWDRGLSAIRRLTGLGTIRIHLDLIAGLPYDGMSSIRRSFNELYALRPGHLQLGFLKVLPGTEMMERAEDYGITFAKHAPYQALETRWITADEMRVLERVAYLVDRLYNTGRFGTALSALAGLYESPFDLYRDLAAVPDAATPPLTRSWDAGAGFLLNAAASRFPGKKSFFLDALRWDWCAGTRLHRYPGIIKPYDAAVTKKAGYSYFRNLAEGGIIRHRDADFRLSDIRRAIFFKAESDQFSAAVMNNNRYALFLPEKKIILY